MTGTLLSHFQVIDNTCFALSDFLVAMYLPLTVWQSATRLTSLPKGGSLVGYQHRAGAFLKEFAQVFTGQQLGSFLVGFVSTATYHGFGEVRERL